MNAKKHLVPQKTTSPVRLVWVAADAVNQDSAQNSSKKRLVQFYATMLPSCISMMTPAIIAYTLLNLEISWSAILSGFLVMHSMYLLDKIPFRNVDIQGDAINNAIAYDLISNHKKIALAATIFEYAVALLLTYQLGLSQFLFTILCLPALAIYSILPLPECFRRTLRCYKLKDVIIVKNIYVASMLTMTSVWLALSPNIDRVSESHFVLLFSYFLLRFFVNVVAFDIPDLQGDFKMRTMTIPIVLGVDKTVNLLKAITLASPFVLIFVADFATVGSVLAITASHFYVLSYLRVLRHQPSHDSIKFWIDLEFGITAVVLMIYNHVASIIDWTIV